MFFRVLLFSVLFVCLPAQAEAMVFKGVTVEFTWTPDPARLDWAAGPVPTGPTPSPVPAETTRSPAGRTLYLTITLPDLVAMEVRGTIKPLSGKETLMEFSLRKTQGDDYLRSAEDLGRVSGEKDEVSDVEVEKTGDAHVLRYRKAFSDAEVSDGVRLRLTFVDRRSDYDIQQDDFTMRF
ncbi:hypothetical protein [Arhodomonas aquaeolei]|uniref:hypothetical protein n=1 Tax=Arhodomonas aquaeolei TaxID=2369 RepID=UPI000380B514|nr:hypothetical protein [Arhodomonas aquaeolei]